MNKTLYLGSTTCDNQDVAERLANALVERRLAVCVQIESIQSIYIVDGKLKNHPELRLSAKFLESNMKAIDAYRLANHSDDLGEWMAVKIDHVSKKYLQWAQS
jgi:periplasmic divalent cation tolerance protein